jgi:hypothetical protein
MHRSRQSGHGALDRHAGDQGSVGHRSAVQDEVA